MPGSYVEADSYYHEFTTANPSTGAAQDADSTPTATATTNGADDAAFALTVTNLATGRYKIEGTVPAYVVGDRVQVSVSATVSSVTGKAVVDAFQIGPVPANTIQLNGTSFVGTTSGIQIDMTQAVPTTNTAETVGDALNAARAQGFGKWVKTGTTVTLYAADGSTAVRTFTLDDADAPTQRV